jgi:hypothetical protein
MDNGYFVCEKLSIFCKLNPEIKNPISTQAFVIQILIASEKINLIFLRAQLNMK